jgi:hypothetical protein
MALNHRIALLSNLLLDYIIGGGSNTSTVAMRVEGGNEKGTQCLGL